ncbi:MAG: hypothetical protein P9M08_09890 [Candidatus Erginobacter occultus]|nr:hypothetical protein [Candidatus Erginobacter occultus]
MNFGEQGGDFLNLVNNNPGIPGKVAGHCLQSAGCLREFEIEGRIQEVGKNRCFVKIQYIFTK